MTLAHVDITDVNYPPRPFRKASSCIHVSPHTPKKAPAGLSKPCRGSKNARKPLQRAPTKHQNWIAEGVEASFLDHNANVQYAIRSAHLTRSTMSAVNLSNHSLRPQNSQPQFPVCSSPNILSFRSQGPKLVHRTYYPSDRRCIL